MRAQAQASLDDIDIRALALAVKRGAGKLLALSLLIGAGALGITSMMTPKFASQAQIEIISKGLGNPFESRREGGNNDLVSVRMDKEAIGTHVRSLMSSDLAVKLASELSLASRPEFNSAAAKPSFVGRILRAVGLAGPRAGESDEDRVLAAYYDALRAYQIKDTRGIIIEFRSVDAKLAAEAANGLAELYRDTLAQRTVSETRDARAKLGPQIIKLAEEVAAAEAEVTRFRGQSNIFDGGRERTGLNEQQLGELTAELTRVGTARAEAEARAREAREIAARGGGETLPDVQKSQLVPRLVEQRVRAERQIAELSATLLPGHPRMRQLNADLEGLNRQIRTEVGKIVDGLGREAMVAALREDGVRKRLEEAKKRVVNAGGDDVKLRALESIAKSKRTELERLQAQLEAARTTSDAIAVPVEVQIISRARPSSEKVAPKSGMISLLAMAATLVLGLGWLVSRELFMAVRRSDGAEPVAAARPLAAPVAPGALAANRLAATTHSVSGVVRQLIAKAEHWTGYRTLVCSESERESAGATAVEIARQIARQQRQVILLDWSLDGIGMASELAIKPTLGITDVLSGPATFEDVVGRLPGSPAHVIAAGSSAAGMAAAKDKDRVNMLLDALDEAYDHIVIAGSYDAVRDLFTTIEGCIDVGVVVASGKAGQTVGNFLGYHVADLDIIRYEPPAVTADRGETRLGIPQGAVT
jgi:polysaccharide biosynthesis transport protein